MTRAANNQKPGLNSQYRLNGETIEYNGSPFLIRIVRQMSDEVEGAMEETLVFLIRRYDQLGPAKISMADVVKFADSGEVKTFWVTGVPTVIDQLRLEFEVEAKRRLVSATGVRGVHPLIG